MKVPYIKLDSVVVDYGRVRALDGLSLEVEKGEYVVILGPSGAGKTTLLKVIAGLVTPTRGTIHVEGKDITQLPPEERRIAYLPQEYALFPKKNVWDNVIFSPRMQKMDEDRARELVSEVLDLVNLSERSDAYPHELSGGMKQRVALARAIATNFSVLLLDEPLRALDARLRLALRNELRKMSKDLGFTVLHVTHDQEEAMSIADRIVVLRDGKIEQAGSQEEIYLAPRTRFVAEFVGETNTWMGEVIAIERNVDLSRYFIPPSLQSLDTWALHTIRGPHGNLFQSLDFKSFNVGDKVTLKIKFEALRLLKDTGERIDTQIETSSSSRTSDITTEKKKPNLLRGTIVNAYYLGKWMNVAVKITNFSRKTDAKEITWFAKMPSITASRFAIGDDVLLEIDPQFVFLFPFSASGD